MSLLDVIQGRGLGVRATGVGALVVWDSIDAGGCGDADGGHV